MTRPKPIVKKFLARELFQEAAPNTTKQRAARSIAFVCGATALAYLFGAPLRVDQWFLILVGLAFLPWLGYFIRKGGKDGLELPDPESSATDSGALRGSPAIGGASPQDFNQLPHHAKVVLKTLAFYQNREFGGLRTQSRWVFTVPFGQPGHVIFMEGVLALNAMGLATLDLRSGMFGLSDLGVHFLERNAHDVGSFSDYFVFPG